MIALYILMIYAIIILGGFCMFIVEYASEVHENWQKNVTAEDLRKLKEHFNN